MKYFVSELHIVWYCPVCNKPRGYSFADTAEAIQVTCEHEGKASPSQFTIAFDGSVGVSIVEVAI